MFSINRAYGMSHVSDLNDDQLRKSAPSVFAEVAHERTSERYTQIPTIQVVNALRKEGWLPVAATETKVRDETRKGFAKHLLRFRHSGNIGRTLQVNDRISEIVLLNSHDGSSSYQLHAGIFRLACSNGMIVSDTTLEKQCVRHSGDIVGNVIEGMYSIVDELPEVSEKIEHYRAVTLNQEEQQVLAKAALALRWDEDAPVRPTDVIKVRRSADNASDLWTVFNRAQENILKGGLSGFTHDSRGRVKRTTTREVKSVSENVRLNKGLWILMEEMAKLKSA